MAPRVTPLVRGQGGLLATDSLFTRRREIDACWPLARPRPDYRTLRRALPETSPIYPVGADCPFVYSLAATSDDWATSGSRGRNAKRYRSLRVLSTARLGRRVRGWLVRETSTGRYFPEIDGLRFVAVLLVILYHVNGYLVVKCRDRFDAGFEQSWLYRFVLHGDMGVQLFFVISGLVLGIPFAASARGHGSGVSIGQYFKRRITRLEPPYIIALVVSLGLLIGVRGESFSTLWPHLLASIGYVHGIAYHKYSVISTVAWSLEIEVQFYVLMPLLGLVYFIHHARSRRLMMCAGLFIAAYFEQSRIDVLCIAANGAYVRPFGGLFIYNQLHYFLVGLLLADLWTNEWRHPERRQRAWDVAAVIGWLCIAIAAVAQVPHHIVLPPAIFMAYAGCLRGSWAKWLVTRPPVFIIGGMCYTIYLYHFIVIGLLGRVVVRVGSSGLYAVDLVLYAVSMFTGIVVICSVLFLLFERPFMNRHWPSDTLAWLRRRVEWIPRLSAVGTPKEAHLERAEAWSAWGGKRPEVHVTVGRQSVEARIESSEEQREPPSPTPPPGSGMIPDPDR